VRRLLMISPHFPPDSSAGTHRVRLLAPHLEAYGWRPTVLTVDEHAYEGRIDPALRALVPASLDVERIHAHSPSGSSRACCAWPTASPRCRSGRSKRPSTARAHGPA